MQDPPWRLGAPLHSVSGLPWAPGLFLDRAATPADSLARAEAGLLSLLLASTSPEWNFVSVCKTDT